MSTLGHIRSGPRQSE